MPIISGWNVIIGIGLVNKLNFHFAGDYLKTGFCIVLAIWIIYDRKALFAKEMRKSEEFKHFSGFFSISYSLQWARFVLIENKYTTLFKFLVVLKQQ